LFCGAAEIDHRILGEVSSDEQGRKRFLREVRELGESGLLNDEYRMTNDE
jgi:hypothetical protein